MPIAFERRETNIYSKDSARQFFSKSDAEDRYLVSSHICDDGLHLSKKL